MCESLVYPNLLWRVENLTPNVKKHGPTVLLLSSRWKLKLISYNCVGGDKVQLFMKRFPESSHSIETYFHIFTSIMDCRDGVRYLQKSMRVTTTCTKLCIWEATIEELTKCNINFQYYLDVFISFAPGKDWRNFDGLKLDTGAGQTAVEQGDLCLVISKLMCRQSLPVLAQDFGNLLSTGTHADVVLTCDDKKFKVHKAILSARSDTFRAKLQSAATSEQEEIINIDDISGTVLEDMLRYIYMGEIPDIKSPSAENTFKAIIKYGVGCWSVGRQL